MKQQTAFALAGGMTAFLLVAGSAVVTSWRANAATAQDAAQAAAKSASTATVQAPAQATAPAATPLAEVITAPQAQVTVAPTADTSAALQAAFVTREAAYQQRISEANMLLEQANADKQALAERVATGNVVYVKPAAVRYPVSLRKAQQIALTAAKPVNAESRVKRTELVKFKGVVAYEVSLSKGIVYVDARTGVVLLNSLAPAAAAPAAANAAPAAASNSVTMNTAASVAPGNNNPPAPQPAAQPPAQPAAPQPQPQPQPTHAPSNDDSSGDDKDGDDHEDDHSDDHEDDHEDDHSNDHDGDDD